jgi:hypothetical protein
VIADELRDPAQSRVVMVRVVVRTCDGDGTFLGVLVAGGDDDVLDVLSHADPFARSSGKTSRERL